MRGNPCLRLSIAIIVFVLLGIPVWNLTNGQAVVVVAAPVKAATSTAPTTVQVRWNFTGRPDHVSVESGGQKVECTPLADPVDDNSLLPTLPVVLPDSGADFVISAHWSDPADPQALRVKIEADGFAPVEKTFWSDEQGDVHDVITVSTKN
jgi:uncharacterized glyoxalase superfamily protein PhnB